MPFNQTVFEIMTSVDADLSPDADLSLSYIWTKTCFAYFHNGIPVNMVLLIGMLLIN
jgi:hypothetical protein